jgi:dihydrofolate reductase
VVESVSKLKDDVDGNIYIHGSRRLAQELLDAGLIDELRLMVFPVVLGTGDRLFGETGDKLGFRLNEAKPVGDEGVVILVYERI